jgi:hypothetical protein
MEHQQEHCIACGASDQQAPLIHFTYRSQTLRICPQCLPVLIHAPQKLADKLPGLEKLKVKPHEH